MLRHLVTVSVTAFERADLLDICLKSLIQQTYSNLEIRVFDNSRSDVVQRLVEQIGEPRIIYERNAPNAAEIVVNHQKAFIPGRGRYHMVLSSDWALRPDAIDLMVAKLDGDPNICLVTADAVQRFPETGREIGREPLYKKCERPGSGIVESRRFVESAFWSLRGVGIAYHSLIASDILRYANIEKVYFNQGYEHQAGLELALVKPGFGIIREPLFIELVSQRRYNEERYRTCPRLAEAVARARFVEKNYLDLLSKGFDVSKLRLGLCLMFLKCIFRLKEHPFESLYYALRHGGPALVAALGMILVLPIRAVQSPIFDFMQRRQSSPLSDQPSRRAGINAVGIEPAPHDTPGADDSSPLDVNSVKQN